MTPNPATSTFEGGQVVANGSPSQQNVYLLDGMYNNDDRLGGSQGTQVRVVLDNIEEYQVLANQYSSEYGGGAGAIINMVTRGGTNDIRGRVYSYFRDETLNARGKFLTDGQPKPPERTLQAGFGLGGPIVRNRAHFYFTYERDNEDIAGQKRFPPAAAPLAVDQVGFFTVRANNYFARTDFQVNDRNFLNVRWLLEDAASRGEGFNTNSETPDAKVWEADHDTMWAGTYTSVLTDRLSSVTRFGRIGESLTTAPQGFFNDDGEAVGFDGRDPFSIGQRNQHASYITGTGGTGPTTVIRTYVVDQAFSYFVPSLFGGEHTRQSRRRLQLEQHGPALDLRLRDLPVPRRRALQPGRTVDASVPVRRHRRSSERLRLRRGVQGSAPLRVHRRQVEPRRQRDAQPRVALGQPRPDAEPQQRARAARRLGVGHRRRGTHGRARRRRQVLRLRAGGARPDAATERRQDAVPVYFHQRRQPERQLSC